MALSRFGKYFEANNQAYDEYWGRVNEADAQRLENEKQAKEAASAASDAMNDLGEDAGWIQGALAAEGMGGVKPSDFADISPADTGIPLLNSGIDRTRANFNRLMAETSNAVFGVDDEFSRHYAKNADVMESYHPETMPADLINRAQNGTLTEYLLSENGAIAPASNILASQLFFAPVSMAMAAAAETAPVLAALGLLGKATSKVATPLAKGLLGNGPASKFLAGRAAQSVYGNEAAAQIARNAVANQASRAAVADVIGQAAAQKAMKAGYWGLLNAAGAPVEAITEVGGSMAENEASIDDDITQEAYEALQKDWADKYKTQFWQNTGFLTGSNFLQGALFGAMGKAGKKLPKVANPQTIAQRAANLGLNAAEFAALQSTELGSQVLEEMEQKAFSNRAEGKPYGYIPGYDMTPDQYEEGESALVGMGLLGAAGGAARYAGSRIGRNKGSESTDLPNVDNNNTADQQSGEAEPPRNYNISDETSNPNVAAGTQSKLNQLADWYKATYGREFTMTSGKREGDGSSWHDSGNAFDIVDDLMESDAAVRQAVLAKAQELGLAGLDEYENPSAQATGGHLHFSDHGSEGMSADNGGYVGNEAADYADYIAGMDNLDALGDIITQDANGEITFLDNEENRAKLDAIAKQEEEAILGDNEQALQLANEAVTNRRNAQDMDAVTSAMETINSGDKDGIRELAREALRAQRKAKSAAAQQAGIVVNTQHVEQARKQQGGVQAKIGRQTPMPNHQFGGLRTQLGQIGKQIPVGAVGLQNNGNYNGSEQTNLDTAGQYGGLNYLNSNIDDNGRAVQGNQNILPGENQQQVIQPQQAAGRFYQNAKEIRKAGINYANQLLQQGDRDNAVKLIEAIRANNTDAINAMLPQPVQGRYANENNFKQPAAVPQTENNVPLLGAGQNVIYAPGKAEPSAKGMSAEQREADLYRNAPSGRAQGLSTDWQPMSRTANIQQAENTFGNVEDAEIPKDLAARKKLGRQVVGKAEMLGIEIEDGLKKACLNGAGRAIREVQAKIKNTIRQFEMLEQKKAKQSAPRAERPTISTDTMRQVPKAAVSNPLAEAPTARTAPRPYNNNPTGAPQQGRKAPSPYNTNPMGEPTARKAPKAAQQQQSIDEAKREGVRLVAEANRLGLNIPDAVKRAAVNGAGKAMRLVRQEIEKARQEAENNANSKTEAEEGISTEADNRLVAAPESRESNAEQDKQDKAAESETVENKATEVNRFDRLAQEYDKALDDLESLKSSWLDVYNRLGEMLEELRNSEIGEQLPESESALFREIEAKMNGIWAKRNLNEYKQDVTHLAEADGEIKDQWKSVKIKWYKTMLGRLDNLKGEYSESERNAIEDIKAKWQANLGELNGEDKAGAEKENPTGEGEVVVSGNEFGAYKTIEELREKAKSFYSSNLQGKKVVNALLGEIDIGGIDTVEFTRKGKEKAGSTGFDADKLLVVKYLPQLIKNATDIEWADAEENSKHKEKGESFYYLYTKFTGLAGKEIPLTITLIKVNPKEIHYYNHVLNSNRRNKNAAPVSTETKADNASISPSYGAAITDTVPQSEQESKQETEQAEVEPQGEVVGKEVTQTVAETKKAEKAKPEKAKQDKIEDFGQKIGGARKDIVRAHIAQLEANNDMDSMLKLSFNRIWPEPKYKAMLESGMPSTAVSFLRGLREGYKVPKSSVNKAWAKQAIEAKETARKILQLWEESQDKAKVTEAVENAARDLFSGAINENATPSEVFAAGRKMDAMANYYIYEKLGHDVTIGAKEAVKYGIYRMRSSYRWEPRPMFVAEIDGKQIADADLKKFVDKYVEAFNGKQQTEKVQKEKSDKPAWMDGINLKESDGQTVVQVDRKAIRKYGYRLEALDNKTFSTETEAMNNVKAAIFDTAFSVRKESDDEGNEYYRLYALHRTKDRVTALQLRDFATEAEAAKFVVNNFDAIMEANLTFNEGMLEVKGKQWEEMRSDTAQDYRKGKDVTTDDYAKTFGFRGVQFGEWNSQKERQALLNASYDALMDLAHLLGVDPHILSLNGELGMAFGARGIAGARAHFEANYTVINLTKRTGAGSLAHEWLHALDNYLLIKGGAIQTDRTSDGSLKKALSNLGHFMASAYSEAGLKNLAIPQEIAQAFSDLIKTATLKHRVKSVDMEDKRNALAKREKHVDGKLNELRKYLATPREYSRKKAAATDKQLLKFDNLAKLAFNQTVEYRVDETAATKTSYSFHYTNDALDKIAALCKEVTGSAHKDRVEEIAYALRGVERARKEVQELEAKGGQAEYEGNTDYFLEARKLEGTRGKPYWTSKWEMLARAFSSYLEDKMSEMGFESGFLNHGANNEALWDENPLAGMFNLKPYPEGAERKAINEAYDKFFETVRNEIAKVKDETGEIKFSIRAAADRVEQAGEITKETVKDAFQGMPVDEIRDGVFEVSLPNGQKMYINVVDEIVMTAEQEKQARQEHGLEGRGGVTADGFQFGNLIALARNGQKGTIHHELFHFAKQFMTKAERAVLDAINKNEERQADAYRDFANGKTFMGKLNNIFPTMRRIIDGTLAFFGNRVAAQRQIFGRVRGGEIFGRSGKTDNKVKFSANGKVLLAPNGKPSNLTPEQYRQVRTPEFKKWFGDWEKVARKNAITNKAAEKISIGEHLEQKNVENLFESFGEVKHPLENVIATFPKSTVGKILRHKGVDVSTIAKSLPSIFRNSIFAYSEPERIMEGHKHHPNIAQYHNFVNKIDIGDGKEYYIRMTFYEPKIKHSVSNKRLLHSTGISDIALYEVTKKDSSLQQYRVIDPAETGEKPFVDKMLAQYFNDVNKEKVSKIIDENGEPLVVYHGTNSVFNEFLKGDTGFHFGDKSAAENRISDTNESSKRLIEASLNIRHPFSISTDLGDWNGAEIADFILHDDPDLLDEDLVITQHDEGILQKVIDAKSTGYDGEGNVLFREWLKEKGYDGIRYVNDFESDGGYSYIALYPNQIKSATDNNGQFSADNDDIRYSVSEDTAEREHRPINLENVKEACKSAEVKEVKPGVFRATFKSGAKLYIHAQDNVVLTEAEEMQARRDHKIPDGVPIFVNGKQQGNTIDLSNYAEKGTINHELEHFAEKFMTKEQLNALIKHFGDAEARADAYLKFKEGRARYQGIVGKAMQVIDDTYTSVVALFGNERAKAEKVFGEIESGKIFSQQENFVDIRGENGNNEGAKFDVDGLSNQYDDDVKPVLVDKDRPHNEVGFDRTTWQISTIKPAYKIDHKKERNNVRASIARRKAEVRALPQGLRPITFVHPQIRLAINERLMQDAEATIKGYQHIYNEMLSRPLSKNDAIEHDLLKQLIFQKGMIDYARLRREAVDAGNDDGNGNQALRGMGAGEVARGRAGRVRASISSNSNHSGSNYQGGFSITETIKNFFTGKGKDTALNRKVLREQLEDLTGLKIRWGKLNGKEPAALKDVAGVIRAKTAYDFQAVIPKAGKAICGALGIQSTEEMNNYIAEWILTGAVNNTSAEAAEFAKAMKAKPEFAEKLLDLQQNFDRYNNMSAMEKARNIISFQNVKETKLSDIVNKMYDQWVEELGPVKRMTEALEKRMGKKFSALTNPYTAFRLYRGNAGRAMALIEGRGDKIVEALKNTFPNVDFTDFKTLHQILADVGAIGNETTRNDFITYCMACHVKDMHEENKNLSPEEQYETPLTEAECDEIINNQDNIDRFGRSQKDLVRFSNVMLQMVHQAGLISTQRYFEMKKQWKNYVPMFRVFDEDENISFGNSLEHLTGSQRDVINPLESIIRNTFDMVAKAEKNAAKLKLVNIARCGGVGDIIEEVDSPGKVGETITFKEGGKTKYLQTDKAIVNAINNMGKDSTNQFIQFLRMPAAIARSAFTVNNLAFAVRNVFRDVADAALYAKYGFNPVKDLAAGFMHAWNKDEIFYEWLSSGAAQSGRLTLDRNYTQTTLDDMTKTWKQRAGVQGILDLIQYASEISEAGTRIAVYTGAKRAMMEQGAKKAQAIAEAALQSRDLMDFARGGKASRSANQLIIFTNASIQGWDKFFREFNPKDPKQFAKSVAKLFFTAVLPAMLLSLWHGSEDWYKELPEWQKQNHWIFKLGNTIVRVPKGADIGVRFASNLVENMMAKQMYRKDIKAKNIVKPLLDNMPDWQLTALSPIMEAMANYSFFTERPIVPRREEKLPAKMQYASTTSALAKYLGEKLDISPRKIDHVLYGYTGNIGQGFIKGPELMYNSATGKAKLFDFTAEQAPIVSGLLAVPYRSSQTVEDYYAEWDKQEKAANEFKATNKKPKDFNPARYERMKKLQKPLSELAKEERAVIDSRTLSAERKKDKQMAIQKRRIAMMKQALGRR